MKKGSVKLECEKAIKKIDELLLKFEKENKSRVFTIPREEIYGEMPKSKYGVKFESEFFGINKEKLILIKNELEMMSKYLNKKIYYPIYWRFLIDDVYTNKEGKEFINLLLKIKNLYDKYT